MARRLILDTTVLIDYERRRVDQAAFDDDDLAVASLTVAEYRTGTELADTAERVARCSQEEAIAAWVCGDTGRDPLSIVKIEELRGSRSDRPGGDNLLSSVLEKDRERLGLCHDR